MLLKSLDNNILSTCRVKCEKIRNNFRKMFKKSCAYSSIFCTKENEMCCILNCIRATVNTKPILGE